MAIPSHRIAFGDHLRELRRAQGWTSQERFAHDIGLDRTYVSGIERGRRNPTLDIIVKLARGLGVPPAELLATLPTETLPTETLPTETLARGEGRSEPPSPGDANRS